MQWIVTGNIPVRVNSKDSKVQSIDKIRLFNDLRTADFDTEDIETIIKILKERNYLYSAVPKSSKGSIPIEDFLENFWDTVKTNDKDNAKIKMVEVSQLRFDRDFKNEFQKILN